MKKNIVSLMSSFGSLLSLSPRPACRAQKKVLQTLQEMKNRNDLAMFSRDMTMVGKDIRNATRKYADER